MRHVWSRLPKDQFRPAVLAEFRCRHCGAARVDRAGLFSAIVRYFVDKEGIETVIGTKGNGVFPKCPRLAKGTTKIKKLQRDPRMVGQPKKRKIKEEDFAHADVPDILRRLGTHRPKI